MNSYTEGLSGSSPIEVFRRFRWIIAVILLLVSYRILGLEGNQVLVGLSCRNGAYLIIAVLAMKKAIALRRALNVEGHKGHRTSPGQVVCLILGSFFMGCFLFLQATVFLDLLVFPREATLTDCVVTERKIPTFLTGYESDISGINANGYTKKLPLTPDLNDQVLEDLGENQQVRVIFYEHVRRVVLLEENETSTIKNFWQ